MSSKLDCKDGIGCDKCESRGMCDSYAAFMYEKGMKDKLEQFRILLSDMQCNGLTEYGTGYNDCIKELWEIFKNKD